MNKLSAQELDNEVKEQDDRKPLRKIIDDTVKPIGGAVLGGALAAGAALGSIRENPRKYQIK